MPKAKDGDGKMILALRLADLDRRDPKEVAGVAPKLDLTKPLRIRIDGREVVAVAFRCTLLDAAKCCDILRGLDRGMGDEETGVYLFRRSWSRVPTGTVLTRQDADGRLEVVPEAFSGNGELRVLDDARSVPPPAPRRVSFGGK